MVTDVRMSQASQLLSASYQLYRNMKTNETTMRTVGYSLPEVLHRHVQTIVPATCFSSMEVTVQAPHRRSFGPAPAQTQMQATSGTLGTVQARQPLPESLPESLPEPLPAPLPEPPPEPPIIEPANLRWLYGTVENNPVTYGPGLNSLAVVGD